MLTERGGLDEPVPSMPGEGLVYTSPRERGPGALTRPQRGIVTTHWFEWRGGCLRPVVAPCSPGAWRRPRSGVGRHPPVTQKGTGRPARVAPHTADMAGPALRCPGQPCAGAVRMDDSPGTPSPRRRPALHGRDVRCRPDLLSRWALPPRLIGSAFARAPPQQPGRTWDAPLPTLRCALTPATRSCPSDIWWRDTVIARMSASSWPGFTSPL